MRKSCESGDICFSVKITQLLLTKTAEPVNLLEFEVLTVTGLWDVTPCSLLNARGLFTEPVNLLKLEVLTVTVLWDVTPCILLNARGLFTEPTAVLTSSQHAEAGGSGFRQNWPNN
jgi:hypothetical protein